MCLFFFSLLGRQPRSVCCRTLHGRSAENFWLKVCFQVLWQNKISWYQSPFSIQVSDTQGRLGSTRKPEKEVNRMVIIMILAFLVCWSPYAAFSILVTAHPTIELDARLSAIPAFFAKTASMYNPVIYVFMNKQVCSVCSVLVSCTVCFVLQKNWNTYSMHMWPDHLRTWMPQGPCSPEYTSGSVFIVLVVQYVCYTSVSRSSMKEMCIVFIICFVLFGEECELS